MGGVAGVGEHFRVSLLQKFKSFLVDFRLKCYQSKNSDNM